MPSSQPQAVGRASPLTFSDHGGDDDDDDDHNAQKNKKKAVGTAAAVASQPSPSSTVCDCGCAFSPSCVSCSICGKKRHALSRVSFFLWKYKVEEIASTVDFLVLASFVSVYSPLFSISSLSLCLAYSS